MTALIGQALGLTEAGDALDLNLLVVALHRALPEVLVERADDAALVVGGLGLGAVAVVPVSNDTADILRRMQPGCQRYRGGLRGGLHEPEGVDRAYARRRRQHGQRLGDVPRGGRAAGRVTRRDAARHD